MFALALHEGFTVIITTQIMKQVKPGKTQLQSRGRVCNEQINTWLYDNGRLGSHKLIWENIN